MNPVIALRGGLLSGFELYYGDGATKGLLPLPGDVSHLLMGSEFHCLLDQFSRLEAGAPRSPTSKAAVESPPVQGDVRRPHGLPPLLQGAVPMASPSSCPMRRLDPAMERRRWLWETVAGLMASLPLSWHSPHGQGTTPPHGLLPPLQGAIPMNCQEFIDKHQIDYVANDALPYQQSCK